MQEAAISRPLAKTVSIWEALDSWGKSLPGWQKFMVSYAVRDGKLSDERIGEAYTIYLRGALLSTDTAPLPAIPDSITGRPDSTDSSPLIIAGIKNPVSVNAIPGTAELHFGNGLTLIYGHNGAGKSGFARILSAACFSRSRQKIHPNVYDTKAEVIPASADIMIRRGQGQDETLSATHGTEHPVLRRVSVFDSAIATVHLAQETPLGFQPAGFDVFDEVVRVIEAISKRLDDDIAKRRSENKFVNIFIGESAIKTDIGNLTKDTDAAALRKLAVYGETEAQRLAEIDTQIAELKSKSPADLIKQRKDAKKDIDDLKKRAAGLPHELGDDACNAYEEQVNALRLKIAAAMAASLGGVGSADLKKTGSNTWETFAKSARQLGREEKESYPQTGDPCLLCHRPLDEPSASLIKRFWSFFDDEARVAAEKANAALDATVERLKKLDLLLLPAEGRMRADLVKVVPALVRTIDEFAAQLATRRDQIVAYLERRSESLLEGNIAAPGAAIDACRQTLDNEINHLNENSVEAALLARQAEHILLRHRQVLSQNIEDVCAYVDSQKWIDKAATTKRSLTTRFVTEKQKDLFQTLIEGNYKDRLKQECSELDAVLPIEFKARGSAGKTMRGLQMQGGHKPNEILSEGEQRAVALADFLTEVNLNPSSAGIVLDDPVTSLDHRRKRKIAERLAREAKVRQVIVFTHDLVFLSKLMDVAKENNVELSTHWVDRGSDNAPGHVKLDECPAGSDAYKTPQRAKESLAKARKAIGQTRVDNVRAGASALRQTLEEIIIRDVFKGTVKRWDEQVKIGNLKDIAWTNEVVDEICLLQEDISRLIDAHSTSDEFGGGMPEPGDLEKLIARVDAMQIEAKKKRK
ncbi:MAG: hypothetical protein EOQ98_06655 [Mesorhizobium sp.]|uniref:AAA family ATPase n=1 Tax=Mesorhizobium sp. TaxID=1871066 RepID=UPI000FE9D4AC|nr:AAA family ATPase [Mesorhizobium sp.]RWP01364.1 MAG: hypothetical protein EOQ98_06655 [Mesorhizobium sp.]